MGGNRRQNLRGVLYMSAALMLAAAGLSCSGGDNRSASGASKESGVQNQATGEGTQPMSASSLNEMRSGCPMVVEGAEVSLEDADGGIAMVFTTKTGDVADLRQRVRNLAGMYEMHAGHGHMMWRHMGGGRHMGQGPGMGMMDGGMSEGYGPMPAVRTSVTQVRNGARLELTPADELNLESLRRHVRWHEERMQSGDCWMLQGSEEGSG